MCEASLLSLPCSLWLGGSGAMWVLGTGAPAGEWTSLPASYGRGAEARWTEGKGERGVHLRVDGKLVKGSSSGGHWRFQWGKGGGSAGHSVQRGRVYVWLHEGRRLGDYRWHAHHQTRKGGLHVRQGGVVRAKSAGQHLREHGQEGGRATAEKHRTRKTAIGRKVAAMNAARLKKIVTKKKKVVARPRERRGRGRDQPCNWPRGLSASVSVRALGG